MLRSGTYVLTDKIKETNKQDMHLLLCFFFNAENINDINDEPQTVLVR